MFEPLLFHLFLLYSAIRMINFSLTSFKMIISSNLLSNRHFFAVSILCFETFFHIIYFSYKSEDFNGIQKSVSLIPLHSMVLMSVLGSSAFGVVKKRFQEINMKQKQKKLKTEIVGMPPSYITVDSSYDDYPLVANEEEMLLMYSNVNRKSYPSRTLYKSMLKDKQLTAMIVSGKDIDSVGEFLNHDIFQKLSVIQNYKSKMKNQKALKICNEFSRDHCLDPLAKDNEGTWYLEFAGTLQLLLTGSAMSIILVAYHCDLYIVFINSIDMGAERKTIQVVDISS